MNNLIPVGMLIAKEKCFQAFAFRVLRRSAWERVARGGIFYAKRNPCDRKGKDLTMLVLNRRTGEEIVVPQLGLVFTILEVQGDKVSVGITAPLDVKVHRREVWERIQRNAARETTELAAPVNDMATATA